MRLQGLKERKRLLFLSERDLAAGRVVVILCEIDLTAEHTLNILKALWISFVCGAVCVDGLLDRVEVCLFGRISGAFVGLNETVPVLRDGIFRLFFAPGKDKDKKNEADNK